MLAKAEDKLRIAEILLREQAWGDAVSRAYYAVYHAVSALHLARGNSYSSHAQSIGQFNKEFVKQGLFPREFSATLTRLFEDRQSGDYDIAATLDEKDAQRDVADAANLLAAVRAYLKLEGVC